MPDQENWSEWMWLAMGVAVVVAALVIWIVVLALRTTSGRTSVSGDEFDGHRGGAARRPAGRRSEK